MKHADITYSVRSRARSFVVSRILEWIDSETDQYDVDSLTTDLLQQAFSLSDVYDITPGEFELLAFQHEYDQDGETLANLDLLPPCL